MCEYDVWGGMMYVWILCEGYDIWGCTHVTVYMWRAEGDLVELVPLFHFMWVLRVPKLTWNIFPAFAFSISLVISACLSWKQHLCELKENLVWPSWSYNENFRGIRTRRDYCYCELSLLLFPFFLSSCGLNTLPPCIFPTLLD